MVQEDVSVREETHRGVEAGYKCWARDGRRLRGRDQVDKLKGPQVCFQHGRRSGGRGALQGVGKIMCNAQVLDPLRALFSWTWEEKWVFRRRGGSFTVQKDTEIASGEIKRGTKTICHLKEAMNADED